MENEKLYQQVPELLLAVEPIKGEKGKKKKQKCKQKNGKVVEKSVH